jgi:hypothetical protein
LIECDDTITKRDTAVQVRDWKSGDVYNDGYRMHGEHVATWGSLVNPARNIGTNSRHRHILVREGLAVPAEPPAALMGQLSLTIPTGSGGTADIPNAELGAMG